MCYSLSCRKFWERKLVIPKQVTWKGWKFTYDNWSWRCQASGKQDGFRIPFTPMLWYTTSRKFFKVVSSKVSVENQSVSILGCWFPSFIFFLSKNRILCWNEALNFYNYMVMVWSGKNDTHTSCTNCLIYYMTRSFLVLRCQALYAPCSKLENISYNSNR